MKLLKEFLTICAFVTFLILAMAVAIFPMVVAIAIFGPIGWVAFIPCTAAACLVFDKLADRLTFT